MADRRSHPDSFTVGRHTIGVGDSPAEGQENGATATRRLALFAAEGQKEVAAAAS